MNKQKLTIILSVGLALGLSGWFAQSSIAQVNATGTNGYQENERDAFTGGTLGNNFNPMDLIHNSNFRRSRNSAQFQEDTQSELQNAADKFKRQQQERIQNQPIPTSPTQEN